MVAGIVSATVVSTAVVGGTVAGGVVRGVAVVGVVVAKIVVAVVVAGIVVAAASEGSSDPPQAAMPSTNVVATVSERRVDLLGYVGLDIPTLKHICSSTVTI